MMRFCLLLSTLALSLSPPLLAAELPTILRETESQGWRIVETANFRCLCDLSWPQARELALSCEAWRQALADQWSPEAPLATWQPRCEVIVHPHRAAYGHTLGRPGEASVGCTSLKYDGSRVVYRRIDLRRDAVDWTNAALPHELTHVVLADRFAPRRLPRWIDEGLAMLAETEEKHELRWTALQAACRNRQVYPFAELSQTSSLPTAARRDAFYSQSVAVVSFLIERRGVAALFDFIDRLEREPVPVALRAVYGLTTPADLDREWLAWAQEEQPSGRERLASMPALLRKPRVLTLAYRASPVRLSSGKNETAAHVPAAVE
jgi:hypothetical protein